MSQEKEVPKKAPKEQTVFVVHGRNEEAKDAMFKFLRCLHLAPLEWEQAREKTGSATPTTLDIVKAGIESAQCVVVLFTGDDLAKLRKKYGDEKLQPQPRPNVIFEAAWSLATAGQRNTILVRMGSVREFSDIDGLNQIHLDNSAQQRKALVSRLKAAECEYDDSGADYLSPDNGGKFPDPDDDMLDTAPETFRGDELSRGRFTNFVADSALLYTVSPIDSLMAIQHLLRQGDERLELKYHYIGATCANYWLELSAHPAYGHKTLLTTLEKHTPMFFDALLREMDTKKQIDLISLGPGDGKIDRQLLYLMARRKIEAPYYYCIDISFELLQKAVATILKARFLDTPRMKIKAIYGDFMELEKLAPIYKYDSTRNLFSLLGNTLGNYEEGRLLSAIRSGMNPEDFLLLDARLHSLEWDGDRQLNDEDKEAVLRDYKNDKNSQFAFGPVEMATTANPNEVEYRYNIHNRFTSVKQAVNIITSCIKLDTRLKSGKPVKLERLDLAATTAYSYDTLKKWLPTKGFRIVWSEHTRRIALFLLRKHDDWGQENL